MSAKMDSQEAAMIGGAFVKQYYNVLVLSPELLYKFYKDCSILGRPDPSGQMLSVTTVKDINKLVTSLDYSALKVEIKTVDSQASHNNGVLVLVTGSITLKNSGTRTFTQSFFLARQENGCFVLNDVVRYLVEDAAKAYPTSEPLVNSEPVAQAQTCLSEQNFVEDAAKAYLVSEPPVAQAQTHNGVTDKIIVEDAAKSYPVNSEPVAQVQALNGVTEQSTTVFVEEVHNNDKRQREVPEGSVIQEEPETEHDHNGEPRGAAKKASVVVQEAPKMSYASILKSQPPVALRKPPLVVTSALPNSGQRSSTASISAPPNSTPVNMTANSVTAEGSRCGIFMSNLPANITGAQVEKELKKFGAIKPSGVQVRSKQGADSCFGFVEFEEAASVQSAVEASPIPIGGRQVYLREKQEKDNNRNKRSVFINNLQLNIPASQVEAEMKKFGAVKPSGVQVRNRSDNGCSYAFVEFEEAASVKAAVEASPILISGRRAYIQEKNENPNAGSSAGTNIAARGSSAGRGNGRGEIRNGGKASH